MKLIQGTLLSLVVLVALGLGGCATSSAPKPAKKPAVETVEMPSVREYKLDDHGKIGFLLPKGWSSAPPRNNSKMTPYSLRVEAGDKSAAVMISVSWDGIPGKLSIPTEQELERMLRARAARQYLRSSVEQKMVSRQFDGTEVSGFYAQFTESKWVNSEVPEGNYRVVTDGVFRCGNLWGSFTIYSQDKSGDSFTPAFAMIKSLRRL